MKKLLYLLVVFVVISCTHSGQPKASDDKDSIVKIFCDYGTGTIEMPLKKFLQVKDSFVYCKEEGLWMTKRLYWFNYQCPDSITEAFTRNGKFVDSVVAYRWGILDKNSNSPAYVFYSVVGDAWFYDIKGNFIEFNRSRFPHSGDTYQYEP